MDFVALIVVSAVLVLIAVIITFLVVSWFYQRIIAELQREHEMELSELAPAPVAGAWIDELIMQHERERVAKLPAEQQQAWANLFDQEDLPTDLKGE
jgi:hypothetical protein